MPDFSLRPTRTSLARFEAPPGPNEAQRANMCERLRSWSRAGVPGDAIQQMVAALRAPDGGGRAATAQHEALLQNFDRLQGALRPECVDKCLLSLQMDADGQTWSYDMHIDDETLVGVRGVPVDTGHLLEAFEDHAVLANLGHYLLKHFGADLSDQRDLLRSGFAAIDAGHAELAGAAAVSAGLEKFRLLGAGLAQLGASVSHCFPGVDISADLREVELSLGQHVLGVYPIADQQALAHALTTLAQACCHGIDQMLQVHGPGQDAAGGGISDLAASARSALANVLSQLQADAGTRAPGLCRHGGRGWILPALQGRGVGPDEDRPCRSGPGLATRCHGLRQPGAGNGAWRHDGRGGHRRARDAAGGNTAAVNATAGGTQGLRPRRPRAAMPVMARGRLRCFTIRA